MKYYCDDDNDDDSGCPRRRLAECIWCDSIGYWKSGVWHMNQATSFKMWLENWRGKLAELLRRTCGNAYKIKRDLLSPMGQSIWPGLDPATQGPGPQQRRHWIQLAWSRSNGAKLFAFLFICLVSKIPEEEFHGIHSSKIWLLYNGRKNSTLVILSKAMHMHH